MGQYVDTPGASASIVVVAAVSWTFLETYALVLTTATLTATPTPTPELGGADGIAPDGGRRGTVDVGLAKLRRRLPGAAAAARRAAVDLERVAPVTGSQVRVTLFVEVPEGNVVLSLGSAALSPSGCTALIR